MQSLYPNKNRKYQKLTGIIAAMFLAAGSPEASFAQIPANMDFAMNNFSNWTCYTGSSVSGTTATGPAIASPAATSPMGGIAPGPGSGTKSRHAITSGSDTDYYGGFKIVCPAGGTYSSRIGNDNPGAEADRIRYYVHVPATSSSYNIQCQFAAVLLDAAHPAAAQSSFQIVAYDSATGTPIAGANNYYIARYAIPGFSPFRHPVTGTIDSSIAWLPWTPSTINLSGMGGTTVVVECTSFDCAYGGHWAYGYFDVTSVQDSLVASMLRYNPAGDSVLLNAPPGYKSYRWYNQNFTVSYSGTNDTARFKMLPASATPQYYNVILTPYASVGVPDTIRSTMLSKANVGVSSESLSAVQVYPNPANGVIRLSFPSPFEGTVKLYNALGEAIYSERLSKGTSYAIPTVSFAAGTYTLVLEDGRGASATKKVLIKH